MPTNKQRAALRRAKERASKAERQLSRLLSLPVPLNPVLQWREERNVSVCAARVLISAEMLNYAGDAGGSRAVMQAASELGRRLAQAGLIEVRVENGVWRREIKLVVQVVDPEKGKMTTLEFLT